MEQLKYWPDHGDRVYAQEQETCEVGSRMVRSGLLVHRARNTADGCETRISCMETVQNLTVCQFQFTGAPHVPHQCLDVGVPVWYRPTCLHIMYHDCEVLHNLWYWIPKVRLESLVLLSAFDKLSAFQQSERLKGNMQPSQGCCT